MKKKRILKKQGRGNETIISDSLDCQMLLTLFRELTLDLLSSQDKEGNMRVSNLSSADNRKHPGLEGEMVFSHFLSFKRTLYSFGGVLGFFVCFRGVWPTMFSQDSHSYSNESFMSWETSLSQFKNWRSYTARTPSLLGKWGWLFILIF